MMLEHRPVRVDERLQSGSVRGLGLFIVDLDSDAHRLGDFRRVEPELRDVIRERLIPGGHVLIPPIDSMTRMLRDLK